MSADRTEDFLLAVQGVCLQRGLTQEAISKLKSSFVMKPIKPKSPFMTTAGIVATGIKELQDFIKSHRRQFMSAAGYSKSEKDGVEQEVGQFVNQCGQQINHMKESILAAQENKTGRRPNEQTIAHLHGVVLILAEHLHATSTTFDKCRALRYQQSLLAHTKAHSKTTAQNSAQVAAWPRFGRSAKPDNSQANDGSLLQQQTLATDRETMMLLEELSTLSTQARAVEQSLNDVAILNQMFSTAVLAQAEQIELLYDNAVRSTINLTRGNEELRKTIEVNRSSRRYLIAFFMIATIILLLFHRMNK